MRPGDDSPRGRMAGAIQVCNKRAFPASPSGFLRAAHLVERFCYPLALGFWPNAAGVGPVMDVLTPDDILGGGYAVAISATRCARKAHVAVGGGTTRLSRYERRHNLQWACAEVRSLARDFDLDWLAKRVGAGLLGGREL